MRGKVMKNIKYLVVKSEDEVCYDISKINNIQFSLAGNFLDQYELDQKSLKPLEKLMVISLENDDTAVFSTSGLEMYFD